jgi:hypothetical protein
MRPRKVVGAFAARVILRAFVEWTRCASREEIRRRVVACPIHSASRGWIQLHDGRQTDLADAWVPVVADLEQVRWAVAAVH